jgi:hypothetical protein
MTAGDDVFDNLFPCCASRAYLEIAAQRGQFPPDSEATRLRAYQLYEDALAESNGRPRRAGYGAR